MTARGFQTVCSRHLGDWNADGTLYRHVRTGMEVFHVDSKDGEYFFAYSFRTLPQDSSGVFHILEHTVLSGSRRYPVKDPFSILDAHSCNSYMNALTCPDRTLYPAASPVRKDFDNIFALYTDSVFRPLLRRQDFESEGIRVGREGFEGVVFNEMRGETSRKDSIVSSHSKRDLFEGSPYFFSSGGDVMAMTGLSYEEYRRTYERFYCPANCRLFIYGHDLDIGRILEDLDRDYLSSMDGGAPVADPVDPPHWDAPRRKEMTCQATGGDDKGEFVLSFLTSGRAWDGYDNIFVSVLADALLGGPSNPLYSALLECGLGDDLSDNSGMSADFDRIPFSVGMDGVDAADAPRLESFIMDSLERIAREGIGEDVIEAAIRRQEFLLQEVSGGIPNGLRMFFKCIRGWERGLDLGDVLDARSKLAGLRCDLEANPRLFEDWMLSQLVDNPHRLGLYVRPVADQAERQEGLLHDIWLSRRDRWHETDEEDEARSIDIPILTLDDIREEEASIRLDRISSNVLFEAEDTCGITYISHVTDLSDLDASSLVYAVLLSRLILIAGTLDHDAAAFHGRLRLESGGYYAYLETGRAVDGQVKAFFVITVKCLTRRTGTCLDLMAQWIHRLDIHDRKAIQDALNDIIGDYASYIEESGSSFASSLAGSSLTPSCSLAEKLMGIGCWQTLENLSVDECIAGLEHLMACFENRRRVTLHLCAQECDRQEMSDAAGAFIASYASNEDVDLDVVRTVEEGARRIWCPLPSSLAYNAIAMPSSPFLTRQQEAEGIFAQICSSTRLWELVRMEGGAYGAEASLDSMEEVFNVSTYRDPHVSWSFDAMRRAMEEVEITDETVDNCKMIRLGRLLRPLSPSQKATLSLRRYMYRIDDDMRRLRREYMRSVTCAEVEEARARLLSRFDDACMATLCSRSLFSKEGVALMQERSLPR